ncbi:MAG TPA: ABC transporter ATP-binding protein [Gemmatimonadales bacterium]|nr:ABC transporter ATP-binding protein [Gemmatimonadales bacterium]
MIVAARNLAVRYPGAGGRALDGVSFEAHPGQLLAISGPNGSGKTTLLRALLGLLPPEAGTAVIGERPAVEWGREALARAVGVVPQREETVFPLTVGDMVMLGRYARLGPVAAAGRADHAAVAQALARCDVTGLASRRVDELSGGEWQRVRVARAIAQEPRILILDEPTTSLDVRHAMELFELMRELVTDGLTGIVITHELNLAARFADRMLLLDGGRVAAAGRAAEVLTPEVLAEVFRWPVAVSPWRDGSPQMTPLRPSERDQGAVS